jgi:subtilase family protein
METLIKPDDHDNDHDDTRPGTKAQPRRVAVKFIDDFDLPYEEGAEKYFSADWKGLWEQLFARFPGIALKPVYTAVSSDRIKELVALAVQRDPTYRPPNFFTFFAIDISTLRRARNLAKALTNWKIIEYAYVESLPLLPRELTQPQRYVESPTRSSPAASPEGEITDIGGIGVDYAWDKFGVDGSGISFVDIEKGWSLNHPGLLDSNGQPKVFGPLGGSFNYGINPASAPTPYDYSQTQHGTSVLGILVANVDSKGWKGIAYGARGHVVSPWGGTAPSPLSDRITGKLNPPEARSYQQPGQWNIANAILIAIDRLDFGDVLVLEVQAENPAGSRSYWPIEIEPSNFHIIRLATALGIVVVEAAGNGGNNLNNIKDTLKDALNQLKDPNKEDSGAIIVGAAIPTNVFENQGSRSPFSNYGNRVDCFAWGDTVYSLDIDGSTGNHAKDTANFTGTSAATAIVAGAAIVLRGVVQKALSTAGSNFRFSAFQMRNILRDRSLINGVPINTPSANPEKDQIGVMPNLQRIIENTLNLVPDVVIRDFADDTGDPHSRELLLLDSPNVSVSANGELDREVSVQVFNRGRAAATGVQATVYWTNSSTDLLRPDQWTKIGTSSAATVPIGTSPMTALPRIFWPAGQRIGNYWLIVTVGCPGDPDPIPDHTALPKELSTAEFLKLIQSNNNITLKNQEKGPILG